MNRPLRSVVIGRTGQVACALRERAPEDVSIIMAGRPELDLATPATIAPVLSAAAPDVVVNAAAYTAVDQAEGEPAIAETVNGSGAAAIAAWCAREAIPLVHLSTDYVFDGRLDRPYREDDAAEPMGAYGRTKLAGERAVAAAGGDHVILRTAWVYGPFGRNFVKTMVGLARTHREVAVVDDQRGSPTSALDLADGVLAVCAALRARRCDGALRGVFHMAGAGEASWADLAEGVFAACSAAGAPAAQVRRISGADYPARARRPANSRLDCAKLAAVYGIALPPWRGSVAACVARLLQEGGG